MASVTPATAQIQLARMSQRAEVLRPADDWTGVTSTAERRKLQNRLSQRRYRGWPLSCPRTPKGPDGQHPPCRTFVLIPQQGANERILVESHASRHILFQ